MIIKLFHILSLFIFPLLILMLTKKYKKLSYLSPVLLCYAFGIILANIKYLPIDQSLSISVSEITVPLAIPLILFQTNFKKWLKLAKKTLLSFVFVIVSAATSTIIGGYIFSNYVDEHWKISGMLAGVYTGGTPNLMAIGLGLNIKEETLILVNTSDVIIGGIYFIFLITIAKWLFGKFLIPFEHSNLESYSKFEEDKTTYNIKGITFTVFLSIIITAIGVGITYLIFRELAIWSVMLIITSLSIGASFINEIQSIKGSYEVGQYLLLVFSFAIGTTVNFNQLLNSNPIIFLFVLCVVFLSVLVHFLLAFIFKIDVDTMIITSTAGIYGPVFVGPIASAIKNKEVIISGLTSGLVGYAIGNYLGFLIALILRS